MTSVFSASVFSASVFSSAPSRPPGLGSVRSRTLRSSNPSLIEPFAHRTLRSSNPSLIEPFAHLLTSRIASSRSSRCALTYALSASNSRSRSSHVSASRLAVFSPVSSRLATDSASATSVSPARLASLAAASARSRRSLSTLSSLDADDASLSNFRADASAAASRVSALDVRRHASAHSRRHDASSASASARAARSAATASRGGGDVLSALSRSSSAARWAASWAASDSPRRASSSSARSRRVVSAEAARRRRATRVVEFAAERRAFATILLHLRARAAERGVHGGGAGTAQTLGERRVGDETREGGGRGGVGGGFVGGGGIVVGIGVDVPAEGARARPGGRGIRRVATRLARTIARRAGRGGGLLSLVALRQLEVAEERLEPRVAARARGLGTLGQTSETRLDRGELARAARRDERLALRRP